MRGIVYAIYKILVLRTSYIQMFNFSVVLVVMSSYVYKVVIFRWKFKAGKVEALKEEDKRARREKERHV